MRDNKARYAQKVSSNDQVRLAVILDVIRRTDGKDYTVRNKAVFTAMTLALNIGYKAGVRIDQEEPEWPVVYIELPAGQVTWHVPQHPIEWDRHSDEEKNVRIDDFIASIL